MRSSATPTFIRRLATALACLAFAGLAAAQEAPLKVAVYDAPPYGLVEPDGSIDGVSVDLGAARRRDEAPVGITASQEWRPIEDSYFGWQQ